MDNTSAIAQVKERLDLVQDRIAREKSILLELEGQERRLTVALEVLESLGNTVPTGQTYVSPVYGSGKQHSLEEGLVNLSSLANRKSTRQLILEQFVFGEALTRLQVSERIKSTGQQANEQTIASTLSKLITDGILEKEGNAYRPKGAAPSAEDTESDDDPA